MSNSAVTPDRFSGGGTTDFRLPLSPPIDPDVAIPNIYLVLQNIIRALVNSAGISNQDPSTWSTIAGLGNFLTSGNNGRLYVPASEAIAQGALVSLFFSNGALTARNANAADNTKPADGIAALAPIASGSVGEVQLGTGVIVAAAGTFAVGSRYFLSKTIAGAVTTTAPSSSGNIEQYVGIAVTTSLLFVNLGYWITH